MKHISIGDRVSDHLTFQCTDLNFRSFADFKGKNVVLYFYPKDNTPGCTRESKDFNEVHAELEKLNTQIIGVSRDTLPCHQRFHSKLDLSFQLISDPQEEVCQYFDVVIKNNLVRRFIFGIERSTFLIDKNGIIRHIWRRVSVNGHAQAVLQAVKHLVEKKEI
jgi:thioredoxin-dependent peroxiredoxin